jgi:hypothetical protein
MIVVKYLTSMLLIATLASCGGGSGSSSNESADGFWEGYITDNDELIEVVVISAGGKFVAFDEDVEFIVSGSFNTRGDKLTSTDSKSYDPYSAEYLSDARIDGIVNTKSKIMADIIDVESGEKSQLSLDYNALAEESISYSDISGLWDFLGDDGRFNTIQVDRLGNFSEEVDGCTTSGRAIIPNNNQRIVSIEINITGDETCYIGQYTGLGLLNDGIFIMIATNNQYAIGGFGIKPDQNY